MTRGNRDNSEEEADDMDDIDYSGEKTARAEYS